MLDSRVVSGLSTFKSYYQFTLSPVLLWSILQSSRWWISQTRYNDRLVKVGFAPLALSRLPKTSCHLERLLKFSSNNFAGWQHLYFYKVHLNLTFGDCWRGVVPFDSVAIRLRVICFLSNGLTKQNYLQRYWNLCEKKRSDGNLSTFDEGAQKSIEFGVFDKEAIVSELWDDQLHTAVRNVTPQGDLLGYR